MSEQPDFSESSFPRAFTAKIPECTFTDRFSFLKKDFLTKNNSISFKEALQHAIIFTMLVSIQCSPFTNTKMLAGIGLPPSFFILPHLFVLIEHQPTWQRLALQLPKASLVQN